MTRENKITLLLARAAAFFGFLARSRPGFFGRG